MSNSGSNYEEKKLSLQSQLEETERQIEKDSVPVKEVVPVYSESNSRGVSVPLREAVVNVSTAPVVTASGSNVFEVQKVKLRDQKQQLDLRNSQFAQQEQEFSEFRVSSEENVREKEAEASLKLGKLKATYDTIDKRQKSLLQEMLHEKKELGASVQKLKEQQKGLSEHAVKREDALKRKYEEELKVQREQWIKVERAKREKWVTEQTAKIKEVTVKGQEPELQRIMENKELDIAKEKEKCALQQIQQRNEQMQHFSLEKEALLQQVLKSSEMKDIDIETIHKQRQEDMHEVYTKKLETMEHQYKEEVSSLSRQISDFKLQKHSFDVEKDRLVVKTQQECAEMYDIRQKAQLKARDESDAEQREVWKQMMMKRMEVNLKEKRREEEQSIKEMREKELLLQATKLQEERKNAQVSAADKYERLLQEATTKKQEYATQTSKQQEEQDKQRTLVKSLSNAKNTKDSELEQALTETRAQLKHVQLQLQQSAHDKEQLHVVLESREEEISSQNSELAVYRQQTHELQYALARKDEETQQGVELAILKYKQTLAKNNEKTQQDELSALQTHVQEMLAKKDTLLSQYKQQLHDSEAKIRDLEQRMELQKYELLAQLEE